MLETIDFRKAAYIDINLLYYFSFKGYDVKFFLYFFNFSLILTLVLFINKFFDITIDIVPEKSY